MRSVLEFNVDGDASVEEAVLTALDGSNWTHAKLEVPNDQVVGLARDIIAKLHRGGHEIPVSPDSRFIQAAIDGLDGAKEKFQHYTFERTALAQALLILLQIPSDHRAEAFQRKLVIIKSQTNVYGVLFLDPAVQKTELRAHAYQARLRSPDQATLQQATVEFVSAMSPTKGAERSRQFSSRSAAVTRRSNARPFTATFSRVEIRSVTNELLLRGHVIPIRGKLSLLWHALNRSAGRLLLALSVLLVGISAILFGLAAEEGWWHWAEQLAGRLATGAFGALLIDGAIDYSALRESVSASGQLSSGALIEWKPPA